MQWPQAPARLEGTQAGHSQRVVFQGLASIGRADLAAPPPPVNHGAPVSRAKKRRERLSDWRLSPYQGSITGCVGTEG
jgi:hypothetical protein